MRRNAIRLDGLSRQFAAFVNNESGQLHVGFSYLMITFAASIPLGMACIRLYDAMCAAGGAANLIIGLF